MPSSTTENLPPRLPKTLRLNRIMKALIVEKKGQPLVVKDVAKPTLSNGEALVKTKAVALNPTDFKHAAFVSEDGVTLGCDYAGEVVESQSSRLKVGDRVAGFVHGGRAHGQGSFAEFVKIDAETAWKIPSSFNDWEEAAAMGGIAPDTAQQHIVKVGFPWIGEGDAKGEPYLVWAASTSVGLYAVQLAKLIGCTVIATASEKNWSLLKSLGADDCYDYKDPETPAKIAAKYPQLSKALDCIATGDSAKLCSKSLGKKGGYVTKLLPSSEEDRAGRDDVKVDYDLIYRWLGKGFQMGGNELPADKGQYGECKKFKALMPELVSSGKLKSNPLLRQSGGIDAIPEGLKMLQEGKTSAQKITYKLE